MVKAYFTFLFTYVYFKFIIQYEGADIGVTSLTWNVSQTYPITFQDCVNMMFIDAIWMGVLAWYIAKIWPSEFGTHQPFYFLCLPSYWLSCFGIKRGGKGAPNALNVVSQEIGVQDIDIALETVTENLTRQVEENSCVDIIGLYKEFKTSSGKKVAVDGLNLTMFSGQITALLGHNGAGKVTMVAVLVLYIFLFKYCSILSFHDYCSRDHLEFECYYNFMINALLSLMNYL